MHAPAMKTVEESKYRHAATSDEVLMQLYADGDVEAFDELVHRHKNAVYAYIFGFTRHSDSVDDLFQNVFIRIIQNRHRYRPKAKFTTWLYTITRSVCIDEMRKNKRAEIIPLFPDGDGSADPIINIDPSGQELTPRDMLQEMEIKDAINETIRTLPESQREVLLLREKTDLTFDDIGNILGCSPNTAKSRMHYALLALRKALRKRGIESS